MKSVRAKFLKEVRPGLALDDTLPTWPRKLGLIRRWRKRRSPRSAWRTQQGDTLEGAAAKTGLDTGCCRRSSPHSGEGSLGEYAQIIKNNPQDALKLLDRDGDGNPPNDLAGFAEARSASRKAVARRGSLSSSSGLIFARRAGSARRRTGVVDHFHAAFGLAHRARDLGRPSPVPCPRAWSNSTARTRLAAGAAARPGRCRSRRSPPGRAHASGDGERPGPSSASRVDREVEQRELELVGVGAGIARVLGDAPANSTSSPSERRSSSSIPVSSSRSIVRTSAPSPRAKLTSWLVRLAARQRVAAPRRWSGPSAPWCAGGRSGLSPASTTAMMLRKSCTTVPVNRPIASASAFRGSAGPRSGGRASRRCRRATGPPRARARRGCRARVGRWSRCAAVHLRAVDREVADQPVVGETV